MGFPTREAKTLTLNFIFTYCLPRQLALTDGLEENSDNEGLVDDLEDLDLDEDELLEATATFVRGSGAAGARTKASGPRTPQTRRPGRAAGWTT